jgi:hypothetical protein
VLLVLGFMAARLMLSDAREETVFFNAPLLIPARPSLMSLVALLAVEVVAGDGACARRPHENGAADRVAPVSRAAGSAVTLGAPLFQ